MAQSDALLLSKSETARLRGKELQHGRRVCSGLPLYSAAAILEDVQHAGCNGSACHAQMYIMSALLRHGSEAQKRTYLPKIATGELRLQALGVTEPTSDSDTSSIKAFAERRGDRYVVNGQKVWTSRPSIST